jgi:hypothetical protein
MTMLAVVLMLEVIILALVRRCEDDVASCDEEKPIGISALGNEETASAPSPRRRLGTDGETQCGGNRYTDTSSVVEGVGGCEELGTGRAGNDRLTDLDIDIGNVVFHKELPALEGHDGAIMARKRCGHHPDPENDGGERLSDDPDPDDVRAGPLYLHRVQKGMELEGQVVFPDLLERVVSDNAEILALQECIRAGGCLPPSASASN